MFNKFLAANDKLLEITIWRTHQDHTLIDLGPIDINKVNFLHNFLRM